MEWRTKNENEGSRVQLTERKGSEDGVVFLDLELEFDEPTSPKPVSIRFDFDCIDTYSVLSPTIWSGRYLGPNWQKRRTTSRLSSGLPVHTLVSLGGQNRMTVAISDADTACEIGTGIIEEDGHHDVEVRFFRYPINPITSYKATVRVDFTDQRYEKVLANVERWWSEECGYKSADVPEHARLPMYSTWYSFHQNVNPEEIVKQCRLAKAMGMESVIVDDGWQTEDANRGYAFCGDWEVAPSKVPDMKAFVDAVHAEGMKYLMWFGMPFVGVHSKAYKKFEGKYLGMQIRGGKPSFAVLDPRFPEVRQYLVDLYGHAVRDWGLDGLKLDFIDSFQIYADTPAEAEGRDTQSLDDGVNKLMEQITSTLKAIKPDVMIEFRQTYVGPAIRKYGNMLRVCDCPLDALINRRASSDLRFISGKTAIHSDMIMWNVNDTAESAAVQMISTLFCVPQISVKIDEIPESHRKMLEFYLGFWRENRDVLLDGEYRAESPESFYTLVSSQKDGHLIAVNYVETVLNVGRQNKLSYVNGSGRNTLTVRFAEDMGEKTLTVRDCTGKTLRSETVTVKAGIADYDVPRGGMLTLE